ncbi:SpoIIE family protein phosphatase [Sporichthya polymorpha]|uniref:SpoIIE family protein phosphatase n=1 Tax=Sporichthya polymorpha TaxID=35751 RepID=UPI00037391D8|nr:SpoIIE family protein phosphatase [Sporichthya polymorpha]
MTAVSATLAPEDRSPAAARQIVHSAVTDAGLDHLLDEALLLTTELVTNALVHGGTAVDLQVEVDDDRLRVEVSDRGDGRVLMGATPGDDREGGRGIWLVDALSSAWGTRNSPAGKTVWFELGKPGPEGAPPRPASGAPARRDLAFLLGLAPDLEQRLGPERLVSELLARVVEGLHLEHGWVVARGPADPDWSVFVAYDDAPGPDPEAVCRGLADDWPTVPFPGADGAVLGALVLGRLPGDADDFALVRLVAERVGVILRDEHAKVVARRTRGSLTLLAEAGEMFAGTLDVKLTATLAARLTVPRLATWAAVWTLFGRTPALEAVAHADESLVESMRAHLAGPQTRAWLETQMRQGVLAQPPAPKSLSEICGIDPRVGGECFVLPLTARGRLLGLILVGGDVGRTFVVDDLALLADLSRTAALALDNARLYEEQTAIAEGLQSWLLPRDLPEVTGCEFGARYSAGGEGTEVGGDFYDVFPLPGGGCGIAIGDVCGKGAEAAAITGIAREVLRMLVRDGASPQIALSRLNETLLGLGDRGRLCTVVLGTVRRRGDGIAVRFSSAGHPPPVHVAADPVGGGRVRFVGTSGSLLGVLSDIDVSDDEVQLAPGESLVLYTDGVTERRGEAGEFFGEDNLLTTLRAAHAATASELAGVVETACRHFGASGAPRDDLAVLVVQAAAPTL